ncbi:MAG TPA: GGDEF domain-containing protein, partial [Usitatibacteraceae bacterium]|nr:GGDEF domain-containing protein [Usitatibacteraceae bacterium]
MPSPILPREEVKRLAARLVALGAIPIAVFCGAFALGRAALGATQQGQMWTWMLALGAAVVSVFVLARRTARVLDGEVQVIREAVRHTAGASAGTDLPELSPPLEGLKREVQALATDFQAKEQRLQERLDNARQQVFFLASHDPLTGLANRKTLEERLESALAT